MTSPPTPGEREKPKRIQRKRTKGWRSPEGAVYVGNPSRWGNPHDWRTYGRAGAVAAYRTMWERYLDSDRDARARLQRNLGGKDLLYWCPLDQPCHADVLLELANSPAVHPTPCGGT